MAVLILVSTGCESPPVEESVPETIIQLQPKLITVSHPDDIETLSDSVISAFLYSNIRGLDSLPLDQKKMKFVSALLPAILVAKDKLYHQKKKFETLLTKKVWESKDSVFFHKLAVNYKTSDTTAILRGLETHPNSIVLAQAAIESGWGNSRIFGEGNNLFGIWSYNSHEPRIPARIQRDGQTIYLRKYADISESISDYFRTLGRSRHYAKFRRARSQSSDVEKLIPHLINYSERKEAYINQLRTMIRYNQLKQYDHYRLDSGFYVSVAVQEE
ncbi:MAG: glucosaminidase domain-containing protein [Roseivirga sp.]